MRRVVVTGMGIVSSIGNNTQEVLASLREAKPGIVRADKYAELGFRCQVHGAPTLDPGESVDRRAMRFLGGGAGWNHVAMEQAIRDAGLEGSEISNPRTGIIMGSGGPSARTIVEAADTARTKGPKRVGPFAVPKAMSSTASATLATWFKIKGVNYSISSACATSNHCIGNAFETIQVGKQDLVFAGGCEELDWTLSVLFDAMGAMSTSFNQTPGKGLARLRRGPRRLRHCRRRRRAGARGTRACPGARRENLRRGRRLRRHLRRHGHGAALGRGRGALHANGAGPGQAAGRLYQPACHLDADRRSAGDRGDPRGVRREMSADRGDEIADRAFARRCRRTGGDLLAADDEQRLHLRERQYRQSRSRLQPTCRSCASAATA